MVHWHKNRYTCEFVNICPINARNLPQGTGSARCTFFKKKNWRTQVLFAGSELGGGVHTTHSLRFASGAIPTDSWQPAWQLSCSLPYTCKQVLMGLETRTYHAADKCSTDWAMLARLRTLYFHDTTYCRMLTQIVVLTTEYWLRSLYLPQGTGSDRCTFVLLLCWAALGTRSC